MPKKKNANKNKYSNDNLKEKNSKSKNKSKPKNKSNSNYKKQNKKKHKRNKSKAEDIDFINNKINFEKIDLSNSSNSEDDIEKINKEEILELSRAIDENIVKREDLFVVTKCWLSDKIDPEKALQTSLGKLNLSYVDLYLDHWPCGKDYTGENKFERKSHNLINLS